MHEHTSSRRRRMSIGAGTAALSMGLCLCAGQLVATPAASAMTPVVQAVAPATSEPGVRTTVSTKSIAPGGSVRITVRSFDPQSGKAITSGKVRLQAQRSGKWINWGTPKGVNSGGTAAFTAAPKISGNFRAVYLGNGAYTSHTGAKVWVKVRQATGNRVLTEAKSHTGALYKFGAAGPQRFDCSGYTLYVYRKALGRKLPHKAHLQQRYGTAVSKSSKKAGDLIVFRSGSYGYHAGIYAGNGYMYDSPHSGARVGKHKIWSNNYVVRRIS